MAARLVRVSEPVASLMETSESGSSDASALISAIRARSDGCSVDGEGSRSAVVGTHTLRISGGLDSQ